MNKKSKIIIIAVAALLIIAAIAVTFAVRKNKTNTPSGGPSVSQNTGATDTIRDNAQKNESDEKDAADSADKQQENTDADSEKVYTPTFMYFISSKDADFDKTNEVIERLKKEYGNKVTFDIRNVDDDPKQLENFPVENQTPALIMLNTKNDISNFLFQNGKYEDLKAAIDAALK